jgi:hypothetical protein
LIEANGLQFVEISRSAGDIFVNIFVFASIHTFTYSYDKWAGADVIPILFHAAKDEKTGVVKLRGCYPFQEDYPLARCGCKAGQFNCRLCFSYAK